MNAQVENCFFDLLRAGLWKRKADASLFRHEVNWSLILSLAEKQAVVGLVADGIYSLPESLRPPKELQLRLHLFLVRLEQAHVLLNKVLKEIVLLFDKHQIPHILLKGQGLAQLYPYPERRTCGDIDLYVGDYYYKKACRLIKEFGHSTGEKEIESKKHFHCHRNGVTIEIHRLAEKQYNWVLDFRFQRWTQKYLEKSDNCRKWSLDGCSVILPPVQFDVLYILNHLAHHFIALGVGLRQVCDWVRFLSVYGDDIDRKELQKDLNRLGMWRLWKIFGGVAVKYLGFPSAKFPFYHSKYLMKSDRVWKRISRVGNFGKYSEVYTHPRPSGYFQGKLHSFYYQLLGKREIFYVFPKETMDYLCEYLVQGIGNVLRHK